MTQSIDEILDDGLPAFHGFARGNLQRGFRPPLSVAISRQTGSRGGSIARRVAELLSWQFLDQETLEFMTQDESCGPATETEIDADAAAWVADRMKRLAESNAVPENSPLAPLARTLLAITAGRSTVILGRGAGSILPPSAMVHVHLIAPERDRIAYMAQLERLSLPDAQRLVAERDEARRRFMSEQFHASPDRLLQYDLVLNTSLMGIDASAEVIATAAAQKEEFLQRSQPWPTD